MTDRINHQSKSLLSASVTLYAMTAYLFNLPFASISVFAHQQYFLISHEQYKALYVSISEVCKILQSTIRSVINT